MISSVLGCTTSEFLYEIIISIMSIYSPSQPPIIIFDYAMFIVDRMHDPFMRFENEKSLRYSSVLYHLFLYYQADRFPIGLKKLDTRGNPRSVIFLTSLIHQSNSQYSYKDFIDFFVYPMTTILLGSSPPRISAYIRRVLQLLKQYKVGDWYLYQNHTEITIYGCRLAPYKLPKYLPMRLFSLQYYR